MVETNQPGLKVPMLGEEESGWRFQTEKLVRQFGPRVTRVSNSQY